MSQTKLLKTDSPSTDDESVTAQPNRLLDWISQRRWYLIGSLSVLILAQSAARQAETPAMQATRQTIEAMSKVERDRLRHNQQQFQKLSTKDVQRIRDVHAAVQSRPQLSKTVSQFHAWLATLSLPQREKLLAATEATDRVQMVQRLMTESVSAPGRSFAPLTDMAARPSFSSLRVPSHDFERMMVAIARWIEHPDSPETDSPIDMLEYHTFIMAGLMDRILPLWSKPASRPGNRLRPVFPEELRTVVFDELSDSRMKRMLQERPATHQNMMAMLIVVRGLFEEARRTVKTLRPSDAELARIAESLPETRRKYLEAMPQELADRHLQQLWLGRQLTPEAAENLSRLWMMFDKMLNRSTGGQRVGSGTNRQGRDSTGFPPTSDTGNQDR